MATISVYKNKILLFEIEIDGQIDDTTTDFDKYVDVTLK